MNYAVELTSTARDFLKKQDTAEAERILKKIYSIRENPVPHLKKLTGSKLWRLRIGKYRAIVDVIIKGKRMIVLRIGKRKNIYD